MTSHGRGRGFRRNPEAEKPIGIVRSQEEGKKRDDEELRSRDSPLPLNCSLEGLLQLIEAGQDMRKITKCLKLLCNTEESLRFVIEEIHTRSLTSESFGKNAARALSNVSQLEVSGVKLRDVVLRCIQGDFKRRQDIREQDELLYLRAVSLLCEVFHHLRLADGTVINVLSVPILEYFNSLLSSPCQSAAFELLGAQTQIIGEEVQRCKPEKFADFLLKIRKLIIEPDSGLTLHSRCVLLHILESHLLRWPTALPEKTGEFYGSILGHRVHSRLPAMLKVKEEEDAVQPRPSSTSPPVPRVFNTPPPNMLQHQQHFRPTHHHPPPTAGRYPPHVSPPPPQQQQLGAWGQDQQQQLGAWGQDQQQQSARFGYQQELRDPPVGGGVSGYPDHPPLNGVERIAADMMAIRLPQGGPPPPSTGSGRLLSGHGRGPGGWQAMPPILPSAHASGSSPNIPTAIVPPGVPPHGRPLGGGSNSDAFASETARIMESRPAGAWSSGGPQENAGSFGGGRGMGRDYGGHHAVQQPPEGPTYANGGRTGGSGRIISSSSERGGGNNWGSSTSGPDKDTVGNTWAPRREQQQQQFDIGTWENPGGSSSATASAAATAPDSGWSTEADWPRGANNSSSWSTADTSTKDPAWSTGTDEIGHWSSEESGKTSMKQAAGDWRNDSAGSVELSPGSQWKKEPAVSIGNWADAVPSPRSDQDDNPLNVSLETVARKIVW